jgi:hypothetical protein
VRRLMGIVTDRADPQAELLMRGAGHFVAGHVLWGGVGHGGEYPEQKVQLNRAACPLLL